MSSEFWFFSTHSNLDYVCSDTRQDPGVFNSDFMLIDAGDFYVYFGIKYWEIVLFVIFKKTESS